jgi:nucleotide-binding universal stress UspA family protein
VKVLFATDGGRHSEIALELLTRLGDPGRVEVHVLTVDSFGFAMELAEELGHYSVEAAAADAQRVADETVAGLKAAAFTAAGESIEGDEATEILRVASERGADLIVVGSAKERWVDTVVLGSVSSSIVHASDCPVLVVHRVSDGGDRIKVLIGADGSEGSHHAIEAFAGFADPLRCTVEVLTVAPAAPLPPGGPAGAVIETPDVTDRELDAARSKAQEAAGSLLEAGFTVETRVVPGAPAQAILDTAAEGGHDLVVVGARGLGRFRAKVLGSVSDRVLRKAPASLIGR